MSASRHITLSETFLSHPLLGLTLASFFLLTPPSSLAQSAPAAPVVSKNYTPWPAPPAFLLKAKEQVEAGQWQEALSLLDSQHKTSPLEGESLKLLGNLKMRQLLSPDSPDKQSYSVKRGDSLFSIARKNHCSADYIIAINKIDNPNKLSIGDTLKLRPLNFSVHINAKKRLLTLLDQGVVVKEFPILGQRYEHSQKVSSKIASKVGVVGMGAPLPQTHPEYPSATKELVLSGGTIIGGKETSSPQKNGFFLSAQDCTELSLFLVAGNEVTIEP